MSDPSHNTTPHNTPTHTANTPSPNTHTLHNHIHNHNHNHQHNHRHNNSNPNTARTTTTTTPNPKPSPSGGASFHPDIPEVTESRRRASLFRMCNPHTQTAVIELREALETLAIVRGQSESSPTLTPNNNSNNNNALSSGLRNGGGEPVSPSYASAHVTLDDVETHLKQALEVLLHSGNPNAPALSALSSSFHRRLQAVSNELSAEVSQWLSATYSPRHPHNLQHSNSDLVSAKNIINPQNLPGDSGTESDGGDAENAEVVAMLKTALDWDHFDVFKLNELTGGKALSSLAMYLFQHFNLIEDLQLSVTKLRNFWQHIEGGYRGVPYHNNIHAADVLQELAWFIDLPSVKPHLKPLEICAALVAAGIHDHEHPGLNNSFLINTSSELALRYNDRSVLEHHHASSGLIALQTIERNNFLSHLDRNKYQNFRQLVISMVLATDMSGHFQLQADFTTTFADSPSGPLDGSKRELLLQQLLHCADLANTGKPFWLAETWGLRVGTEFFCQGDKEKDLGLQVSAGNNRHTNKVELSQMAFIQHIVKPMFEKMLPVIPETQILVDHAANNIVGWTDRHNRLFGPVGSDTHNTTGGGGGGNSAQSSEPSTPGSKTGNKTRDKNGNETQNQDVGTPPPPPPLPDDDSPPPTPPASP